MSESFLTAAFLSISGGLQDAYTYIYRGEVFANAQTGNIVLLSQSLVERKWSTVIHYLIPLGFFAMGIVVETVGFTDGNAFTACGRIPSNSMQPSGQCHGILCLCHAGADLPQSQWLCICQHHVYRQYPKRHGISVCLWKDKG